MSFSGTGGGNTASRSLGASPNTSLTPSTSLVRTPSQQAVVNQHRHVRLEQLTTQLFWRLQQSAPHHSSSVPKAAVSSFPKEVPFEVGPVVSGLEESNGALYELGVADDGTFIGLAEDEMNESIATLRIMASTLGCIVEVLRMVDVGDCSWRGADGLLQRDRLWVAEAHVKPNLGHDRQPSTVTSLDTNPQRTSTTAAATTAEQLRVSLTGSTMSGKSSLLGCLTTATLDNGRGKSRLNLLKHRHEIASGMTSSVTQELIGYTRGEHNGSRDALVVNYAGGNVSSWTDIHASAQSGRLVLLSDSAGHPRYRRTTVRGLVGWDPHWTIICIPADDTEDTSGMTGSTPPSHEVFGVPSVDVDLSNAHLELCLKLKLPLVVVITKLDLASRAGLRNCLSKVLTTLKAAGRKPYIQQNLAVPLNEPDLLTITAGEIKAARQMADVLREDPVNSVPIILASAVKGNGICKLHAFLYELPIPRPADPPLLNATSPHALFHVEDVFSRTRLTSSEDTPVLVLGGHVHRGSLSIGDELALGPYSTAFNPEDNDPDPPSVELPHALESRSFPGTLHRPSVFSLCDAPPEREWWRVKISSLRNLRLPVRTLEAGQVGTVGVVALASSPSTPAPLRIRKGMVLAHGLPKACSVFEAEFARQDVERLSIKSGVVIYTNSVRASAKVMAGSIIDSDDDDHPHDVSPQRSSRGSRAERDGFGLVFKDDDSVDFETRATSGGARLLVTFQFIASREYVEAGGEVLVMPGGGPGLYGGTERGEKGMAGLDGFVGDVTRILG